MKTPVALIIFKRPDTTEKVFEAIRRARPPKLFAIADGARSEQPGESQKCAEVRAIIDRVDWDCEVITNYSETNLGCKLRPATGIDWVFQQVEEAIILEDDCLPDPTFFTFCDEMLARYRHDERIMAIAGSNFQFGSKRTNDSYYFSRYPHCWGWATWRRAWQHFDLDMQLWPLVRDGNWLQDIFDNDLEIKYWQNNFQGVYDRTIDTVWDYQWTFACWVQNGLTILPNVNLTTNIGFGVDATHTDTNMMESRLANMPVEAITMPIQHPQFVMRDSLSDRLTNENVFAQNFKTKMKSIIKRRLKYILPAKKTLTK
jgi:hypothetical protein